MNRPPIRRANMDDLSAVQNIVEAAYAPYTERMGKRPGPMLDDYASHIAADRCHVLEIEGRIAGLSVVLNEPDRFLLDNVAIDPADQGKGYGKALVEHAESHCRASKHTELWLYTHVLMTENVPLYTHLGFKHMHRVTEKGYDRIYMMKSL